MKCIECSSEISSLKRAIKGYAFRLYFQASKGDIRKILIIMVKFEREIEYTKYE